MKTHKETILGQLRGTSPSTFAELWCAVGYYQHGNGRSEDKSFATPEEWQKLLEETGRAPREAVENK